jgi:phosphate transport system substrate-binding protein
MQREITRRSAIAAGLSLGVAAAAPPPGVTLSGAGATFPAPLYARLADAYHAESGATVRYDAVGSSEGLRRIQARLVDFGASDKPLKPDALAAAGLFQFPTVIGGVVPVMNVPGLVGGQLHLTGALLASIFAGQVTRWNDARIVALNAGAPLPDLPIAIVHRGDGSGTTFLFTSYLSMVNPAFARQLGANDVVSWPTGAAGTGNAGVADLVRRTVGAIGYVEFAYAKQNRMAYALVQNQAGAYPQPVAASFAAAAARADWAHAPGNYLLLLNQPGGGAWPITGATFILVYRRQADAAKGRGVLGFFDWVYGRGDPLAQQLDYVPLPGPVKALVRSQWAAQLLGPDGRPLYAPHG